MLKRVLDVSTQSTYADLTQSEDFIRRHIGPNDAEQEKMLTSLGVYTVDELIEKVIPGAIRIEGELSLAQPKTEAEVLATLKEIASKNKVLKSCIGQGYYDTLTPTVILRNLMENPAWYTAYTPYQPEISQGRLEVLLNFQTMVGDLTGMDIANASLLDEATAAAEAMTFCKRLAKNKSNSFFVSSNCHPQTIDVVNTRASPDGHPNSPVYGHLKLPHLN